ncbi:MAG TPA: efflux RND transporter periplasmic adaptor subunit [Bacteroidia bacterium]|jgi:membrane fusion protein (multidrug efflux system)
MKKRTLLIIIIIISALVLVKIFFLQPENREQPKGGNPKAQTAAATGYVASPLMLENNIYSSGTVLAAEEVELRPEMSGKLVAVLFKEGTIVNKGELLAKINDADFQAQLKKLNLQYKLSREREGRVKGLLDIKGVSQEEYDVAANELETIEADMDFTRAQIAKTEIRAPFRGKIGLKSVSEGSFVTNANVIASIQQTDLLKIDFAIPEKYAALVKVGDTVKFSVEGIRGKLSAKVAALEPRINSQTRNMMVRAIYNNPEGTVYPGAFAKVELIASKKQSFMIPSEALIPEMKGSKIFIVRNGKAFPQKVETGVRSDAGVEILSGLKAGDTVITTGIMSLKPEMNVKIIQLKK